MVVNVRIQGRQPEVKDHRQSPTESQATGHGRHTAAPCCQYTGDLRLATTVVLKSKLKTE